MRLFHHCHGQGYMYVNLARTPVEIWHRKRGGADKGATSSDVLQEESGELGGNETEADIGDLFTP